SRCTFWTPYQTMEPEHGALHLYGAQRDSHHQFIQKCCQNGRSCRSTFQDRGQWQKNPFCRHQKTSQRNRCRTSCKMSYALYYRTLARRNVDQLCHQPKSGEENGLRGPHEKRRFFRFSFKERTTSSKPYAC